MNYNSLLKKDMTERCRAITRTWPFQEPVHGEDHNFLLWLIARHPSAADKIGCGIDHFEVRPNTKSRKYHSLWLVRKDGTATDFSWVLCVRSKPTTHREDVLWAFRDLVREQVTTFKTSAIKEHPYCAVTGERITLSESHADHYPVSFQAIADTFITWAGGYGSIEVRRDQDGQTGSALQNKDLAAQWQAYHATWARLRLVAPRVNLSKESR